MKGICIAVVLVLLATGAVFANEESPERVATDAQTLLKQQEDKSAANHDFMNSSVLMSRENRIKLNQYRAQFSEISGRIYVLKNRISVGLKAHEPKVDEVAVMRDRLQGLIDEHDKLINEYKQWVASLPK